MTDVFESRFHSALTSLFENRAIESDDVRQTAVTTLADLMLESARIGERRLPDHFDELMQALLPRVSPHVRADLARRLAHCDLLPAGTARMLAGDEAAIAGPILRQSPVLDELDLIDIATGDSDEKARSIAGRTDLTGDLVSALIDRQDAVIAASLALSGANAIDDGMAERIARVPSLPRVAARRLIELADLSDEILAQLFWAVESDARRRIIDRMARRHSKNVDTGRLGAEDADQLADALFALAAAGEHREIAARLSETLGLPQGIGQQIIADPQGEALAIATRAAGLSPERITGIVLLAVPEAGRSFDILRTLVGLAEDLTPGMARHITDLWGLSEEAGHAAPRYEPAVAGPAASRQRGATSAPRRLEDVVADITRKTGS